MGERRCKELALGLRGRSRGVEVESGRIFVVVGRCRVRCLVRLLWRLDEERVRGDSHGVVLAGIGLERIFCEGEWCQNGRLKRRLCCGCWGSVLRRDPSVWARPEWNMIAENKSPVLGVWARRLGRKGCCMILGRRLEVGWGSLP